MKSTEAVLMSFLLTVLGAVLLLKVMHYNILMYIQQCQNYKQTLCKKARTCYHFHKFTFLCHFLKFLFSGSQNKAVAF